MVHCAIGSPHALACSSSNSSSSNNSNNVASVITLDERIANLHPQLFAVPDESVQRELRALVKHIDDNECEFNARIGSPFDYASLYVDNDIDIEQIWQAIELRNHDLIHYATSQIRVHQRQVAQYRRNLHFHDNAVQSVNHSKHNANDKGNIECNDEVKSEQESVEQSLINADSSVVNDTMTQYVDADVEDTSQQVTDLFDKHAMENFINQDDVSDKSDDDENEEGTIDLFSAALGQNSNDEEEDENIEEIREENNLNDLNSSDSDDDNVEDMFEEQEFRRLRNKIDKQINNLEEYSVQPRSWELMGEVKASDRPQDSLLQTPLEVEMADKRAPIITQETTTCLEDIIRQRIKHTSYDDVERNNDRIVHQRTRLRDVDSCKPALGLAEVYEKQFVEARSGTSAEDTALDKQHQTISVAMAKLCHSIDSLCNFHYTPPPPLIDEANTPVSNTPAILMEEAIPITVTEGMQAAPEQLHNKQYRIGEAETREQRKSVRAALKRRLKKVYANTNAMMSSNSMNNDDDNNNDDKAMMKQDTTCDSINYSKSTAVFKYLNDECTTRTTTTSRSKHSSRNDRNDDDGDKSKRFKSIRHGSTQSHHHHHHHVDTSQSRNSRINKNTNTKTTSTSRQYML